MKRMGWPVSRLSGQVGVPRHTGWPPNLVVRSLMGWRASANVNISLEVILAFPRHPGMTRYRTHAMAPGAAHLRACSHNLVAAGVVAHESCTKFRSPRYGARMR